jgi:hypothetical protein
MEMHELAAAAAAAAAAAFGGGGLKILNSPIVFKLVTKIQFCIFFYCGWLCDASTARAALGDEGAHPAVSTRTAHSRL